jgi:hypothetical protein
MLSKSETVSQNFNKFFIGMKMLIASIINIKVILL